MHNRFLDKRRRKPNLRLSKVKDVLPEHFISYYPKFIKLLEYYYTFEDENDSTELLSHLFAARDINETDITLLSYIEDELLLGESYFKGFGNNEVELRAAANFSSILFRSKGTKFAIEWFFRSFYNSDVEVVYPKENIFKIGDSASTLGYNSLRYLTDDKLYQTFALLIKTGVPISRWREVFKLFSHPAGMYLAGEVAITDIVEIETIINDYVATYPTASYQLGGTFTVDEGQTINLSVNGTNVNNGYLTGTDGVYWYGRHGSTSDSDFGVNYYDGRSGLPDSNEPQYIDISSSTGVIPISIINDPASDPLEAGEWFAVRLEDKENRYLDSANIFINDLIESYNLTFPNNGNLEEGSLYTINLTGVNVPNYGETTVKYYFDPVLTDQTLRDSDFYTWYQNPEPFSKWSFGGPNDLVGLPDSARCGVPVEISGGVGSFVLDPRVDGIEDGTESITLKIANVNNVEVGSGTFTISNNNPFIIVNAADIIEGNNLIIQITTESYNVGKYLNYEITGDVTTEIPQRLQAESFTGSLFITNPNMQISIPTITNDTYNNAGGGLTSGTITFTDPNITASEVTGSATFNIQDAAPQYQLLGSENPGVEGNNITYNVTGTNIPDGTVVWFWIVGVPPVDANPNADWTAVMPQSGSRQSITINNNSGSSPTYTYESADAAETREYYEAYIYSAQTGGVKLAETSRSIIGAAQSVTIQIKDISGSNTVVSSIDETGENSKYRIEVSAPFLTDGIYRFYLKTDATYRTSGSSAEFGEGAFIWEDINEPDEATTYAALNQINPTENDPGGIRIVSGSGSLDFFATSDNIVEGNESYIFYFAESINNTLSTLGTHSFTINDTSTPEYTITTPSSLNETENFTVTVNIDAINNEASLDGNDVLYFELSGAAASYYTSTQAFRAYSNVNEGQTDTVIFNTVGDNSLVDPDRAGILHVTRGDYNSGSPTQTITTKNFTLTDNAVIASNFIADPDTFDEGNSTTFRWNPGQYANDGITYWIRPTNVLPFIGNFDINNTSIVNVTPDPLAAFTSAGWVDGGSLVDDLKIFSSAGNQIGKATAAFSTSITSTSTSSSTSTQTEFWVGRESEVWDYFDVTSNSQDVAGPITYVLSNGEGTRITTSAVNAAVTSDGIFTFGLYPNHTDQNGSELATEVVTISNISTGATIDLSGISGTDDSLGDFQFTDGTDAQGWLNDYEYEDQSQPAEAVAKMRFNPDGTYRVSTTGNYIGPNVTWANGSTGTGAGYWIRVREQNNSIDPTDNFSGISLGVWEELTTTKEFGVTASAQAQGQQQPSDQQTSTVQVYIDIVQAPSAAEANVIFANANANKDTKDVIMRAQAISIGF